MTREPQIHPTATIGPDVKIGDWSTIGPRVIIEGDVEIGRAAWINPYAEIGGGRKELGSIETGDFFHMGKYSFVNIADRVKIGHEVGLGMRTDLFTHGGYPDETLNYPNEVGPITIGHRAWLPQATVLPNVTIGEGVVVAAGSIVNRDLPPRCLAGGVPVRILEHNVYLKEMVGEELHTVGRTIFDVRRKRIEGPVTGQTEVFKDTLRRRGIRFRYYDKGGEYAPWD